MHIRQSGEINGAKGAVFNVIDRSLILLVKPAAIAGAILAGREAAGFW